MAKKKEVVMHRCGECANVTPVTSFETLTVHGGAPTMGTCPWWEESPCVLLSWRSACKHFKERD